MSQLNLTSVSPAVVREQLTELYNTSTPLGLTFVLGGVLVLLTTIITTLKRDSKQIPVLWTFPVIGSWNFFAKRHEFVFNGLKRMAGSFKFKVLNHNVVVLSGEEERKIFLSNKDLSFNEGYKILFTGVPSLKDINLKADHMENLEDLTWFSRRITALLKRDRLDKIMPQMFSDLDRLVKQWGTKGTFDPFEDIYNMVFQLTIRMGSCNDIADDPERVANLIKQFWIIDNSSTPGSVLLPWLPSKAKKAKTAATTEIYLMLKNVIDDREQTGNRKEDCLQYLLDQGDGVNDVVQFVMALLFAGIVNTGMMTAWILLHLGAHPEWKVKVIAELREFLAKHSDPKADLCTQLGQIPVSVWEEGMPILELCLRETMRIILSGTMLRRNMGGDIALSDGKVVKSGEFLVMSTARSHLNPDIYTNVDEFDPSRYLPGRAEDRKQYGSWLGWGLGRHPCLGMRFAKLEIKCMLALFLTLFDYHPVDANGNKVTDIPEPDRNNISKSPPSRPIWIKYKKVD